MSVSEQPSEAQFQAAIVQLALLTGWRCYHPFDSRRSEPGWPDLALCKPPRLLLWELKTARGRLSLDQRAWLADLAQCPGIETAVLRPQDWPAIEATLVYGVSTP